MNKKSFLKNIGGFNILLLGLVSLLNDFSSEMILPILPLLIVDLGGSGVIIGLIGGLIQGLPEIFKVFAGYISDKFRRRKQIIFLGYFVSQISKFSMIFAANSLGVLFSTSADKLGKGIREAPRDALISESLPAEKGRAFGIQRAFDSTGAILGSLTILLVVLFFASTLTQLVLIKKVIFVASLIGFLSLIPIFFLKEKRSRDNNRGKLKHGFFQSLGKLPKTIWIFIALSAIFAFANFSYLFFLLRVGSFFTNGNYILPVIPIALYVLYNIFYTVFAIPFGKLSDKIGRHKVLIAGGFMFFGLCIGFLFASTIIQFTLLFILYGLVYAIMIGNQKAFVSDLSSDKLMATSLGAFQTLTGVASIVAGVLAGALFSINNNYLFIFGAVLALIYSLLFLIFQDSLKKKAE